MSDPATESFYANVDKLSAVNLDENDRAIRLLWWRLAWQARDAEVARLREALASISLAEKDTTSSDRQKVVSMARTARQATPPTPQARGCRSVGGMGICSYRCPKRTMALDLRGSFQLTPCSSAKGDG